ncbi:MAG: hypothetical protein HY738_11585 [Bacteroidia bacterium]|nr:hypothetical protein [Bacteroidia bacterium]
MPINGYNTPNIPISTGISQLIVQEHNVIGTTWRQVVVCFTANANYDYLWFYPQSLTTGYSGAIFVDRVELIPIPLNFAGSDHTIPCGNVSIGQDICTVDNLHFQWHIAGQADIIASTSETMVNVETTTVYELNIVPQNANPNTIVFPAQPNNCNLTDQATVIVTGGITLTPFTTDGCEACDASAQVIPAGGTPPL